MALAWPELLVSSSKRQTHLNPERVAHGAVLDESVALILSDQRQLTEVKPDLRTHGEIPALVADRNTVLPIRSSLLIVVSVHSHCDFSGDSLHAVIFPDELAAGLILSRSIFAIIDELKFRADFGALCGQVCECSGRGHGVVMLSDVNQVCLVIFESRRKDIQPVPPVPNSALIGYSHRLQVRISETGPSPGTEGRVQVLVKVR